MNKNNIHIFYTNLIKRLIKASFVGWERENGQNYLRINTKDRRKLIVPFNGNVEDITELSYKKLIEDILQTNETRE